MKTIKELSELINISKVSIYKALKRPEMQPYISKNKDNITIVDETGVKLLTAIFNHEKPENISDFSEIVFTDLTKELKRLNDEISQKNNEINALLNIIANQQKLQATQYIADKQPSDTTTETLIKPKKRFFDKLFKRD